MSVEKAGSSTTSSKNERKQVFIQLDLDDESEYNQPKTEEYQHETYSERRSDANSR